MVEFKLWRIHILLYQHFHFFQTRRHKCCLSIGMKSHCFKRNDTGLARSGAFLEARYRMHSNIGNGTFLTK